MSIDSTSGGVLGGLASDVQLAVSDLLSDRALCRLACVSRADAAFVLAQWRSRLKVSARKARDLRRADVSLGDRFALAGGRGFHLEPLGRLGSRKALHLTLSVICEMAKQGGLSAAPSDLLAPVEGGVPVEAWLEQLGATIGWRALYEAAHRWTCVDCNGVTACVHVGRGVRLCRECAERSDGAAVEGSLATAGCWFCPTQALAERTALRGGIHSGTSPLSRRRAERDPSSADLAAPEPASGAPPEPARPCLLLWGPKGDFFSWMAAQGEPLVERAPAARAQPGTCAVAAAARVRSHAGVGQPLAAELLLGAA